jgi:catechol 2,3-dioxygenase-like lactoylglutathione lyase family enzyme
LGGAHPKVYPPECVKGKFSEVQEQLALLSPSQRSTIKEIEASGVTMNIRRIVPNVQSDRLDESRSFYVELLGLEVAMDMGWIMTLVSSTNPTAQMSILRSDATAPVVPQLTVEVADVDAVHAEAVRRRLEIVYPLSDESWGVRRFFVLDPNGVVLNVMSHPGRADSA